MNYIKNSIKKQTHQQPSIENPVNIYGLQFNTDGFLSPRTNALESEMNQD